MVKQIYMIGYSMRRYNYFNGKYNLIINCDFEPPKLPDNIIIRKGELFKKSFEIKKEELDNDGIFLGNLIINDNFKNIDFEKIFSLPLNDNLLYTSNFYQSPAVGFHPDLCKCDDKLLYCSSFVLWIIGNRRINLYTDCISHRISLKKIEKSFYEVKELK